MVEELETTKLLGKVNAFVFSRHTSSSDAELVTPHSLKGYDSRRLTK
jgi:hypothetical protein